MAGHAKSGHSKVGVAALHVSRSPAGGVVLLVVLRVAAGLRQATADHVTDGQQRHVEPGVVGSEALAVVTVVGHCSGDQHSNGNNDVGNKLGRLERRLGLARLGVTLGGGNIATTGVVGVDVF